MHWENVFGSKCLFLYHNFPRLAGIISSSLLVKASRRLKYLFVCSGKDFWKKKKNHCLSSHCRKEVGDVREPHESSFIHMLFCLLKTQGEMLFISFFLFFLAALTNWARLTVSFPNVKRDNSTEALEVTPHEICLFINVFFFYVLEINRYTNIVFLEMWSDVLLFQQPRQTT